MRRVLPAFFVTLVLGVSTALGVTKFCDNRRICTAQPTGLHSAGATSITFQEPGSYQPSLVGAAVFTEDDVAFSGIIVESGTGNSATQHYKISAYDKNANVATITPALVADINSDSVLAISWGSDVNTIATTATRTSGNSPCYTIQRCYDLVDAGGASAGTVHVRYSAQAYTEANQATNTGYLLLNRAGGGNATSMTIQGFDQASGDLNNSALTGATLVTSRFPTIRPSAAANCVEFDASTAVNQTLRNVIISHASNTTPLVKVPTTTATTITLNQCVIGASDGTDQPGFQDTSTSGNGATNKVFTISACQFLNTATCIDIACCRTATVSNCQIVLDPDTNSASSFDAIRVRGRTWNSSNTPNAVYITGNTISCPAGSTGTNPTNNKAGRMIFVKGVDEAGTDTNDTGPTFLDHLKISSNTLSTGMRGSCIEVGPCPSVEIRDNTMTNSNDAAGTAINLYPDNGAPKEFNNVRNRRTVRQGVVGAGSGATSLVLANDFGVSASDDAYNLLTVDVYSPAFFPSTIATARPLQPQAQKRQISDYVGATKTCTTVINWDYNPVAGDVYEIYQEVPQSCIVTGNWCQFTSIHSESLTHGVLIGQTWDGCVFSHNTIIGGDNGIVLKGDYNTVEFNKVYSAAGTMLIKGGSFNTIRYNSFYMGRNDASGGAGCLQLMDMSYASNNLHYAAYSKCMGNTITDNIFVCRGIGQTAGINRACIYDRADIGSGILSTYPTLTPAYQQNKLDRNLYWRDDVTDEVQTITVTGGAPTWKLTYGASTTSTTITTALTGAQIATVLSDEITALHNHVQGSGGAGGPYVLTFVGALSATDVDLLVVTDLAAGTLTLATTTTAVALDETANTPFFNLGGSSLNRLSDLRTHWAAKVGTNPPYTFGYTDNDANSYEGNPGFASPSTGNFAISRTSPAWGRGFGGSNMGAYQPSSGVTAGTTIIRPDRRVP